MMRSALFLFQLARSKPYCLVLLPVRSLCCAGGNTAHAVNCQVFLPPFYPRAVHVISRTLLIFTTGSKVVRCTLAGESLGTRLKSRRDIRNEDSTSL